MAQLGSHLRAPQGASNLARITQVVGRIHCHGARAEGPISCQMLPGSLSLPRGPCILLLEASSITKASTLSLLML